MKLNIERDLLESFNLLEADNEDGTDNDGGEKVLPGDVQHGFKSKVISKDVVNPTLQELDVSNNYIKPSSINDEQEAVSYRKEIGNDYIIVCIGKSDDYNDTWELEFTINDQFSSNNNQKIMFQVYQFVFDCLHSFIKDYNPDKIEFTGFTEKQDKMYNLFIKNLKNNINQLGYKIEKQSNYFQLIKDTDLDEMRRYAGL